ncbi:MAG: hypothetical protein HY519_00990 [Candidatus Aenigmarchaeota archaeon]|nr:hypothetical protein [Candidatus Aenigmarchaeota archaeon]
MDKKTYAVAMRSFLNSLLAMMSGACHIINSELSKKHTDNESNSLAASWDIFTSLGLRYAQNIELLRRMRDAILFQEEKAFDISDEENGIILEHHLKRVTKPQVPMHIYTIAMLTLVDLLLESIMAVTDQGKLDDILLYLPPTTITERFIIAAAGSIYMDGRAEDFLTRLDANLVAQVFEDLSGFPEAALEQITPALKEAYAIGIITCDPAGIRDYLQPLIEKVVSKNSAFGTRIARRLKAEQGGHLPTCYGGQVKMVIA